MPRHLQVESGFEEMFFHAVVKLENIFVVFFSFSEDIEEFIVEFRFFEAPEEVNKLKSLIKMIGFQIWIGKDVHVDASLQENLERVQDIFRKFVIFMQIEHVLECFPEENS